MPALQHTGCLAAPLWVGRRRPAPLVASKHAAFAATRQHVLRAPAGRCVGPCRAAPTTSRGRVSPGWDASKEEREIAERGAESVDDVQIRIVQWYPGHIARAERQLKEQLKMVDVVLEVRDARVPLSTTHPAVPQWCGRKPRLVIMNRADCVSAEDRAAWDEFLQNTKQRYFWTDGTSGKGVHAVQRAAQAAGRRMNATRERRGLRPRSVRAVMIGFPNVGKSALINRLVARKIVASENRPGVTRALRWVTLGEGIDLLDAPGVIPMRLDDQVAAGRLAMVNDIGEASYVDSIVASALLARMRGLPSAREVMARVEKRYGIPAGGSWGMTTEDITWHVADSLFHGDLETAGARILRDYRNGRLGWFALEQPPPADWLE